jgi:aldose 1-epimerase
MPFAVRTRTQAVATGREATIFILDDGAGGRTEIWPELGFNCFRWNGVRGGRTLDLLYADPSLFGEGRATRSGIPILFPFPNRIRDGRFAWDGKEYQLPLNGPSGKNAIHGFACRRPWRVIHQGADDASAWMTGEFHAGRDAPDCLSLWPADHLIRVTYRLGAGVLRIEAEVENPDRRTLPFGLGYHPYYRTPFAAGASAADCLVQTPAKEMWPLVDCLPTAPPRPVDAARDLRTPRRFLEVQLDDVLTSLPGPGADGLCERGMIESGGERLRLRASPSFREAVVFTPGHREAFCIEPYTCTTDAINLQARGVDAGLLTLPPGGRWAAVFEMRLDPPSPRANP